MEKSNSFLYSFFGLIIFQFFMSLEEILGHFQEYLALLTGKVHKVISFFPVINLNDQFFLFINLLVFIIFIFIGILVFLNFRWSKILAVILGCIEIINGGLHILASLYFMQYIISCNTFQAPSVQSDWSFSDYWLSLSDLLFNRGQLKIKYRSYLLQSFPPFFIQIILMLITLHFPGIHNGNAIIWMFAPGFNDFAGFQLIDKCGIMN